MELKNNDATVNRPLGERAIDAPAVLVHLPYYAEMIKSEKAWQQNDRNGVTVFKSDGMTIVLTRLKAGASLEEIQTEGYSTLFVIDGTLKSVSGEEKQCTAGDLLAFHPCVDFTIIAETDASFLLTHFKNENAVEKVPTPKMAG